MNTPWSYFDELSVLEKFLIASILFFFLSTLLFIFLILRSRVKKIRREMVLKRNTPHIEKTLFLIAFDGKTFSYMKKDRKFNRNWRRKIYRQQFLKELIKMHRLYDGEIAQNLRKCYGDFRLVQLSYEKVKSRKWEIKCAGIQELSEMEIKEAVPVILEHTRSGNETLQMVALTETIRLSGLEGISLLEDYRQNINDWIQLNLLEFIKESHLHEVPDFGYLLDSENESLVVFGLRLLKMFHQDQHLPVVNELLNSSSRRVNLQAVKTFKELSKTGEITD